MKMGGSLEQERARLLARIRRRYEVNTQPLRIGPLELLFTRIADPDRVLDQVAQEEDRREKAAGRRLAGQELHLPYWAELWDSAFGVGQFLASPRGRALLAGAQAAEVLDLGCGMGLAGTVAAALGAHVLFADLETPALLFARLNSLPWRHRVRARRMNWRHDHLGQRFDLILGADILYERAQWDYLEPCWRQHLKPTGHVLLGEPGRQTGELFLEWIKQRPWTLELFEEPVQTRPRPVRLLSLSLPDPPSSA